MRDTLNRYHHLVALALIIACILVVHVSYIPDTFRLQHWEDVQFIKYVNEYVHSFWQCFTAPTLYPGLYRPLTTSCYYYLGLKWFGERIEPFKVFNLLVFTANVFLLFLICKQLVPWGWALVPALLFATRKAHHDQVVVTVEFQTLFAALFTLLTVYLFIRSRRENNHWFAYASYATFVLAMFSKEVAVATVGVLLLYGHLYDERKNLKPYFVHIGIAVTWVALLFGVFRRVRDYQGTGFHYTFLPKEVLRNYIANALSFVNFRLPEMNDVGLRFGRGILPIGRFLPAQILFGLLTAAWGGVLWFRDQVRARADGNLQLLAFGFGFFLLVMLPYCLISDRPYLRYSYIGHAGIAIMAGAVLRAASLGIRRLLAYTK